MRLVGGLPGSSPLLLLLRSRLLRSAEIRLFSVVGDDCLW